MNTADFIFSYLAEIGISDVFMVSGGGAMFLNDALGRQPGIRYICTHHEQGAAIAAEGYSRTGGKLAVVSVTTGPGGTNSLTGVIGEWLDSIPVLFISGQVKFSTSIASCPELGLRQLGDQEINIIDIVNPVTKYAMMVTDPLRIKYELQKAIHLATSGRFGPVWLDIPVNVQSAEINPDHLPSFLPPAVSGQGVDDVMMNELHERLMLSRSPVIVAGHGIRLSGAISDFQTLVNKLKIPILGTLNGFDLLPSDAPYLIGRVGSIGTRAANIALQNADFILCIGTRNNIRQISYNWENFGKRAQCIAVVDIDPAELGKKTLRVTHAICSDAGDFIRCLLGHIKEVPDFSSWLQWNQFRRDKYGTVLDEYRNISHGVQPYFFAEKLTQTLPETAVVVCTNATPSLALFQAGIVKKEQRMFANSGCAAMGYGLPAALGAAVAVDGRRPVVCLEGDGSLMMNLQELQTVKHYKLPIKLFLFNNREYASIRQTQNNFFAGRKTGCTFDSGVSFPAWDKIAAAFGWKYIRIENHTQMDAALHEVLHADEAVFCDLVLVENYLFLPKLTSRKLDDGTLVSASLEDMFPFLSENEQKANVYVSGIFNG